MAVSRALRRIRLGSKPFDFSNNRAYPKEIEEIIDAMSGVVESAVVGMPHLDFGEAVVAVIVRLDNEAGGALAKAGVIGELKGVLVNFKVPKRAHFVADLPRNSMGKVQKKVLREQYA